MKDFFHRHDARLELDDLQRYARILIDDLNAVLNDYEFVIRLLDAPERESELVPEVLAALKQNKVLAGPDEGQAFLPVVYDGRPLALITATRADRADALSETLLTLLPHLIRLSLEKILLYRINVTDQETGLYNDDFFRAYLRRTLKKAAAQAGGRGQPKPLRLGGGKEEHAGLTLMMVELCDYDRWAAKHGRLDAGRIIRLLADCLKDASSTPSCLARLAEARMGLVLPQQELKTAQEIAAKVSETWAAARGGDPPPMRLAFGLTHFPTDVAEEMNLAESVDAGENQLGGLVLERAELALRHALNDETRPVFTFREVLQHGGRVVHVLPYHRVVINVGRLAGAREGQVFILNGSEPDGQINYKGEVVLFEVQDDFSVGEVSNLSQSTSRVQAGDVLKLRQTMDVEARDDDQTGETRQDRLLGIPDHSGFVRVFFKRIAEEDRFAVMLIRVDSFDQYRATMGHIESDRQLKGLFELIGAHIPESSLVGRFSTDSLALFCPGMDERQARELAQQWRDMVVDRHPQTCSFGVAVYPCGSFGREEILINAQKALEHAAFFGPASMAVFDSVSLNISGDRMFEAGDLTGAIQEYQKALELNPEDLNVLNSLGVCHGYQQKQDLALDTFGRVLALDPENLMAHFNRGFALATSNRLDEALESFRRAAQIAPDNFDALFHLGKMALEMDLVDEALTSFERAARLESREAVVFRYLGQTLLRCKRTEEAVDAFKAAVRHDPADAPSLSQLGVLYIDRGTDGDVALSLIRQSVDLDPTNSLFRHRLGRALAATNDLKTAESEYRRAIDMGARSREVYCELGDVLKLLDRESEARDMFQNALAQDPSYRPALDALDALKS